MKTYQYYSQIFNSEVQISYNEIGILQAFTVLNTVEKLNTHLTEFKNYFSHDDFITSAQTHKLKLTEIERVVTFDMFWEKYKEKNCGRTKGEAAWKQLSKVDQIKAYDFIEAFNGILKNNSTAKPYATTYLNQKRWIR